MGTRHPPPRRPFLRLLLHPRRRTIHGHGRKRPRPVEPAALREGRSPVGRPLSVLGRRRQGLPGAQPVWRRPHHHPPHDGRRAHTARRRRHRLYRPRGRGHENHEAQRLLLPHHSRGRRLLRMADGAALAQHLRALREARGARTRQHPRERPPSGRTGGSRRQHLVVPPLPGDPSRRPRSPPAARPLDGRRLAPHWRRHRRQRHRRASSRVDKALITHHSSLHPPHSSLLTHHSSIITQPRGWNGSGATTLPTRHGASPSARAGSPSMRCPRPPSGRAATCSPRRP